MSQRTHAQPMTGLCARRGTHTSFETRYRAPGQYPAADTFAQLHARRVRSSNVDEAQIELSVGKWFHQSKRASEYVASMSLEPAHARQLALALSPEFGELAALVRPLVAMTFAEAAERSHHEHRFMFCRCDVRNPCWEPSYSATGWGELGPGKHWGGGDACGECNLRAAIAKAGAA